MTRGICFGTRAPIVTGSIQVADAIVRCFVARCNCLLDCDGRLENVCLRLYCVSVEWSILMNRAVEVVRCLFGNGVYSCFLIWMAGDA